MGDLRTGGSLCTLARPGRTIGGEPIRHHVAMGEPGQERTPAAGLHGGALVVLATLTARPGRRDELVAAARRNAVSSLSDEDGGCLLFLVVEDAVDLDVVRFVSAFRDQEAFDRHRQMRHFHAWRTESAQLLSTERPIRHEHGTVV